MPVLSTLFMMYAASGRNIGNMFSLNTEEAMEIMTTNSDKLVSLLTLISVMFEIDFIFLILDRMNILMGSARIKMIS